MEESAARLHHLEEHGDRDSYRAHRCFDCGSDQHASGTCEQTAFLLSFQLSNAIEEIPSNEETKRKQLANGIPAGAPSCEYHRTKLQTLLRSGAPDIKFRESISGQTGLLPMCYPCLLKKTLITDEQIQREQKIPKLDACLCATAIQATGCWCCAIVRCDASKHLAIMHRTRRLDNGTETIDCECGNSIMLPPNALEMARRCATCGGVATAPFTNFAGEMVKLYPCTSRPIPQNIAPQ